MLELYFVYNGHCKFFLVILKTVYEKVKVGDEVML